MIRTDGLTTTRGSKCRAVSQNRRLGSARIRGTAYDMISIGRADIRQTIDIATIVLGNMLSDSLEGIFGHGFQSRESV